MSWGRTIVRFQPPSDHEVIKENQPSIIERIRKKEESTDATKQIH